MLGEVVSVNEAEDGEGADIDTQELELLELVRFEILLDTLSPTG